MQPAAVLSVLVTANTGPAARGLLRFNSQLGATEAKANKVTGALKTVGKVGILGVAGAAVFAVKKAADFEQQMDSLGSVSGATGRQMERFKKQALDAGAATKFSALDAAKAQTELAKGGLSVAQIMRGGLKSALALAAAGEMDLAEAAATTANALNLFGLRGKDSMKVADALAKAANATTADVTDFAMALRQSGGVAKTAGLSFTETVLALEALANAGTKNSDAGTSLKTALIQLIKPSEKQFALAQQLNLEFIDQHGNFKSLADVSAMLRDKLGGMTKAQRTAALATLAGTDGVRTLTALYDAGPKKLGKWSKGLNESGTASKVAAEKQDNLKGKIENLMGSVETLAIIVGTKMLPWLTKATESVTKFINQMGTGKGKGGEFAQALKDIWPVIRQLFIWFGKAASTALSWQRTTSKAIHAVGDFFTNVWKRPKKAFGDFIASVLRGFAKLFEAASHIPGIGGKFKDLAAKTRAAAARVDQLGEGLEALRSRAIKVAVDIKFGGKGVSGGLIVGAEGDPRPGLEKAIASGTASWVRSHPAAYEGALGGALLGGGIQTGTYKKANRVASMFGLRISGGFRTPQHNAAVGGVPNSLHTHGSVANPGAIDLVGSTGAMAQALAWARSHLNLKEGLIHDVGSGLHLHLGFFAKGGKALKQQMAVVGEKGPELVSLPAGSEVFSHSRSKAMAAGALGMGVPGFAKGGVLGPVAQVARNAGFKGSLLKTMVAIAMAESSGNPKAHGPPDGRGLWQIEWPIWGSTLGRLGDPFNAQANAKMAMQVYKRQGLGAWVVYNTGAYRQYLDDAAAAVSGVGGKASKPRSVLVDRGRTPAQRAADAARDAFGRRRAPSIRQQIRGRQRIDAATGEPFGMKGRPIGDDVEGSEVDSAAALLAERMAERAAIDRELLAQMKRNEYLITTQGPQMILAATTLFSQGIGRSAALGRRTPASAGRVAAL